MNLYFVLEFYYATARGLQNNLRIHDKLLLALDLREIVVLSVSLAPEKDFLFQAQLNIEVFCVINVPFFFLSSSPLCLF